MTGRLARLAKTWPRRTPFVNALLGAYVTINFVQGTAKASRLSELSKGCLLRTPLEFTHRSDDVHFARTFVISTVVGGLSWECESRPFLTRTSWSDGNAQFVVDILLTFLSVLQTMACSLAM